MRTIPQDGELQVDDLQFTVRYSLRRRTIQITVERDGALVISTPPDVDMATLQAFVRDKRFWIYTRLAEKDRLQHPVSRKEFVDGEGFPYLGRSYRLKQVDAPDVALKLVGGRFHLSSARLADARACFVRWYSARAHAWLAQRVQAYCACMDVAPAGVKVQDLGYRWGSCGKGGWLYFHWKTILLPPRIAEYVVVHEMAHLHEAHHTSAFWLSVERAMPDYAQRKAWLAEHGAEVDIL